MLRKQKVLPTSGAFYLNLNIIKEIARSHFHYSALVFKKPVYTILLPYPRSLDQRVCVPKNINFRPASR